jgi:tRNA1(Val) A37 N6-methylase TrmN6
MLIEDVTRDCILGNRLRLVQPRKGHRAGTDGVLVAAATPAVAGDRVVDFGSGVGTAGLAVAIRVQGCLVDLVEIDEGLAQLAGHNIGENGLGDRVRSFCADVGTAGRGQDTPIAPSSIDHVVSNPPFHPAGGRLSPDPRTARARTSTEGLLEIWAKAAARVLRPGGTFTLIHRPDALPELMAALRRRFGSIAVRPVHPTAEAAAVRIVVQAVKGSRGALSLQPPFILRDSEGAITPEMDAIHRQAIGLLVRL